MILRILTLFLLSMFFSSCAARTVQIDTIDLSGTALDSASREQSLHVISQRSTEIAQFKGLVACTMSYDGKRGALRYLIAFEQPDLLRIEQFPTQGFYSLGLFISTPRGTQYVDPPEKRVLIAESSHELLNTLFNLPLESSEFIALVSGRVPAAWLDPSRVEMLSVNDDHTTMIRGKNEIMRIGADNLLVQLRLFDQKSRRERITLTLSWGEGGSRSFPQGFAVKFLNEDALTECTYRSIELNHALPPKLFEVIPPSDFEIVQSS